MSNAEIFRTYLARFSSGDRTGAAELLTEDFDFHGPLQRSRGIAKFLDGSAGLVPIMRGAEVHRQWEERDEVCSIFDFTIETPAGRTSIPMAEWCTFRDGKIASSRLIFDTAAMAALQPTT